MIRFEGPITAQQTRFVDIHGRHVLLRGVNMISKDREKGYIPTWTEDDFSKLQQWGFNVIRLGIYWEALEPSPGVYDNAYIDTIARWVDMAGKYDLRVFIDMHQDLYGHDVGGAGAPGWATLFDDAPQATGAVWSDAYLMSAAVQRAFDSFWNNRQLPGGKGLQDHYALAWQQIAKRFRGNPTVLGYDLMNEPFVGSVVNDHQPRMYETFARLFLQSQQPTSDGHTDAPTDDDVNTDSDQRGTTDAGDISEEAMHDLMNAWFDPHRRAELLPFLDDATVFARVVDAAAKGYQQFERDKLQPFYEKMTRAIRAVDTEKIIFLESHYFTNIGVSSALEPLAKEDGQIDPHQVYAPHGYDLVVDTDYAAQASFNRLEFIFHRHAHTQRRLNMPMLVGEWGAFYGSDKTAAVAFHLRSIFESLLCSDTYWVYGGTHMENWNYFLALQSPYPKATAGVLERYRFNPETGDFQCTWEENGSITAPTVIYVPRLEGLKVDDVQVETEKGIRTTGGVTIAPNETGWGGHVVVEPLASERHSTPVRRTLKLCVPIASR